VQSARWGRADAKEIKMIDNEISKKTLPSFLLGFSALKNNQNGFKQTLQTVE